MGYQLNYRDSVFSLRTNESVLACLLRADVDIPNSCHSGVCQSCIMQVVKGKIPEKAQVGLKPTLKKRALVLACQCIPDGPMTVTRADGTGIDSKAKVDEIQLLNHNVLRVRLLPEKPFDCEPGQYLTLINPEGVARSYSVANNPTRDGSIELHVRLIQDGLMSTWLKQTESGADVVIRGPAGNCFYSNDDGKGFPIILAGTGTGLAPLYGILLEALASGHEGNISLFHGALIEDDLYLAEELKQLDESHPNFTYLPCVLNGKENSLYQSGDIKAITMASLPQDTAAIHMFVCGAPEMVNKLKTAAFLAGLSSRNIYVDAFLPSK